MNMNKHSIINVKGGFMNRFMFRLSIIVLMFLGCATNFAMYRGAQWAKQQELISGKKPNLIAPIVIFPSRVNENIIDFTVIDPKKLSLPRMDLLIQNKSVLDRGQNTGTWLLSKPELEEEPYLKEMINKNWCSIDYDTQIRISGKKCSYLESSLILGKNINAALTQENDCDNLFGAACLAMFVSNINDNFVTILKKIQQVCPYASHKKNFNDLVGVILKCDKSRLYILYREMRELFIDGLVVFPSLIKENGVIQYTIIDPRQPLTKPDSTLILRDEKYSKEVFVYNDLKFEPRLKQLLNQSGCYNKNAKAKLYFASCSDIDIATASADQGRFELALSREVDCRRLLNAASLAITHNPKRLASILKKINSPFFCEVINVDEKRKSFSQFLKIASIFNPGILDLIESSGDVHFSAPKKNIEKVKK